MTLVVTSVVAIALVGTLGVAVDMGRVFIAKNETQTYCDAGALAASLQMDGTSEGLVRAKAAVENTGNAWNLGTTTVPTPTIEFATASSGPWIASPPTATGYGFVRVTATVPVTTYFSPILTQKTTQTVKSVGVSGQIPQATLAQGLGPYTVVASSLTSSTFGLVVGDQYDIQWPQFNSTRAGCNSGNPDKCFNQSICSGDQTAARKSTVWKVASVWGSGTNGYWGGSANSEIEAEVLNLVQLQPAPIGQPIVMTNGNKNAQAGILDTRVNQDGDVWSATVPDYLANAARNGRRLFALPIVDPSGPTAATVVAHGLFFLNSNGVNSNFYSRGNGNDGFCAVFAGSYVLGSQVSGVASIGSFKVQLVQ